MIDTHIHFWRYRAADYPWISDDMPELKQDRLPPHIAPAAETLGITRAIAVQARCDEAENDFLLDLAAAHKWVGGVVGWLDFTAADVAEKVQQFQHQPLMKGFRHLVQDEAKPSEYWARPDFQTGVAAAQKAGFVYDLLCHQADLPAVAEFAKKCDGHWLVLDHLGKPDFRRPEAFDFWKQHLAELAALPHTAVKISGLVTEFGAGCTAEHIRRHVETAVALFGSSRIMWGSDWPVCRLSGHSYEDVFHHSQTLSAAWSAAEQAAFRSENAQRIYRLA